MVRQESRSVGKNSTYSEGARCRDQNIRGASRRQRENTEKARLGDKCVAEENEALSWKVFRIEEEVKRTGVLV